MSDFYLFILTHFKIQLLNQNCIDGLILANVINLEFRVHQSWVGVNVKYLGILTQHEKFNRYQ